MNVQNFRYIQKNVFHRMLFKASVILTQGCEKLGLHHVDWTIL